MRPPFSLFERYLACSPSSSPLPGSTALLGVRRSVICRPNRLPISSTATRAVRPRSSRNGLSSTMSTERTRSGIVQQLHDQMRLAIGRAARHRGADAGRDRGIEKIDVEAQMQHAVLRPHALDDLADQHADAEFVDRAHVGDRDAALEHQLLLLADRSSGCRTGRAGRGRSRRGARSPSSRSRPGSPHRKAADMPCMLPVSVVCGVL